jgi:hypothetical protein
MIGSRLLYRGYFIFKQDNLVRKIDMLDAKGQMKILNNFTIFDLD